MPVTRGCQPRIDSGNATLLQVLRRATVREGIPSASRQGFIIHAEVCTAELELTQQRATKQQRVVRVHGARHTCSKQAWQWVGFDGLHDAQEQIAGRADVQTNSLGSQLPEQLRVRCGQHTVADPLSPQIHRAVANTGGPLAGSRLELSGVRDRGKRAIPAGDAEGLCEGLGRVAGLGGVEAESDHAGPASDHVLAAAHHSVHGSSQRLRLARWEVPLRGHDKPDANTGALLGRGSRAQQDLEGALEAPEAVAVEHQRQRGLDPRGPRSGGVFGDLPHEPEEIRLFAQALADSHVASSEGPKVGEALAACVVGPRHLVLLAELCEGRGSHRTLQMDVELCLRQLPQAPRLSRAGCDRHGY
mmetsp:Transcript_57419/g.186522  ORF Transcript_57419/g.186522 Transcript_57419/m.186522 type:complete len:360 (+) Transcript_57419:269-1348(+)